MKLYLYGAGLIGPGLNGWEAARPILAGESPYAPAPVGRFVPELLPANERRRTTATIRLALQVADEAVARSGLPRASLGSVFASAEGDTEIAGKLCEALAEPERTVSPTQFHNSVHNAPAGYWAIATGAQAPSTSIAGGDDTFAVALLEVASTLAEGGGALLLTAYDLPAPEPLAPAVPVREPFGTGMVFGAAPRAGALELNLTGGSGDEVSTLADSRLEALRCANPAARALPLLVALARGKAATVTLPWFEAGLAVRCAPVSVGSDAPEGVTE